MFKLVKSFAKNNIDNKSFSIKTTLTNYCSLNVLPMLLKNLESMLNNEHSAHENKNGYITIIFYIIILYLAAIICQFIMGDIIRVIFLMAQPVKNNRPLLTYLMKFFYGQITCENSSFTGSRSKRQN